MSDNEYQKVELDYKDLKPREFSGYYLTGNPFPAIPVPKAIPQIYVNRKEIIDMIADVTKDTFRTGHSSTLILTGTYGSGKSHTLLYVKSKINQQLTTLADKKAIAVYIQNPGSGLKDLYSGIIDDLGMDFFQEMAYKIIGSFLKNSPDTARHIYDKEFRETYVKNLQRSIDEQPLTLKMILTSRFRYLDLFGEIEKSLEGEISEMSFLRALLRLTEEKNSLIAWRWISGEEISRYERETLGVSRNIDGSNYVLEVFSTLRKILAGNKFEVIYLLLDELEDITELHAVTKGKYWNDLRHFIDRNTNGICLIACITPTAWAEIKESGHAISRRLMTRTGYLNPFSNVNARDLVRRYLRLSRIDFVQKTSASLDEIHQGILKKNPSADPELFPFSKDSIDAIQRLAEGNVSQIIRICKRLLDYGCDHKHKTWSKPEDVAMMFGG